MCKLCAFQKSVVCQNEVAIKKTDYVIRNSLRISEKCQKEV